MLRMRQDKLDYLDTRRKDNLEFKREVIQLKEAREKDKAQHQDELNREVARLKEANEAIKVQLKILLQSPENDI